MIPKRRGFVSEDAARFILLLFPTFCLLRIEVHVVSQHSGSEAFPVKCALGTTSLIASMRDNVPAATMFTGVSFQSIFSSSVVLRG
jgi:hypothetical protein